MQSTPIKQKRAKSPEQALASLMQLCARAEKAESDAQRLMRGWGLEQSDAEQVLARLVKDRFIDDARYAGAFVREKLQLSGWGEYKIRAALQRKGVAKSLIEEALTQTNNADMSQRLQTQLTRKARSVKYDTQYELKTKLIRYGLSLGYDYQTVLDTTARLVTLTDSCDNF